LERPRDRAVDDGVAGSGVSKGFSREWAALLRAHGVIDGTSGILDSAGPGGTGKV